MSNFRLHFCNPVQFCNGKLKVQLCFNLNQFFNVQVYLALPSQMIDQVGSSKVCLHGQFQTPFLKSCTLLTLKSESPAVCHLSGFFNVSLICSSG
jgi:hypothetical protein